MTAIRLYVRPLGLLLARVGRRRTVQIAIACGLLAAVFLGTDTTRLGGLFGELSFGAIFAAIGLLIANQLISGLRFHYLASEFGIRQPFRRSFYVNAMSLLGGLAFLNFIGQGATRAALMTNNRNSTSTAFLITAIERVSSLLMLFILAVASSLLALGELSIGEAPRLMLIVFACVIALIIMTALVFALGRRQRGELKLILWLALGPLGWRILGITLAMHACMILAYLTIAADILDSQFNINLVATSTVVMLAASFPISFGGWGIRELTAGYMFDANNLPSEAGVAMGLTIGALSLAAVLINVVIAIAISARRRDAIDPAIGESQRIAGRTLRAIAWLAPALSAVLVNVQLQLPTSSGSVSANLADPIVIVAGLTMMLFIVRDSVARSLWRIPHFNLALGLLVATVVLGFFHGWIRFGLTDWALYNRLVGLGIVLAYLLTGALATASAGSFGTRTMVRALAIACITVVFAQWVGSYVLDREATAAIGWHSFQFSGLLGNRNAFATTLLLVLAVAATGTELWRGRRGVALHALTLGLLSWGVYLSGSRGVTLAAIALLVFLALIPQCRKPLLRAVVGAAVVAVVFFLSDAVADLVRDPTKGMEFGWALRMVDRYGIVQTGRMESLSGGLQLWLEHPMIGGGLGAFMHDWITKTGSPLVIHNSFIWMLAEFGVIGLITFLAAPGLIVARTLMTPRWTKDWPSVAALACILVLIVVSLTHDVAYQRVFWLLIGALVARPGALKFALKQRPLAPTAALPA